MNLIRYGMIGRVIYMDKEERRIYQREYRKKEKPYGMIPKKCIICGKEFFISKSKGHPRVRNVRNGVTCSKPCSRIYCRVQERVYLKLKQNILLALS